MPDPMTMSTTATNVAALLNLLDGMQVSPEVYSYVVPFGHDVARSAAEQLNISTKFTGDDDADSDRIVADIAAHGDAPITILTDNERAAMFALGLMAQTRTDIARIHTFTDEQAEEYAVRLDGAEGFMLDMRAAAVAYANGRDNATLDDITDPRD